MGRFIGREEELSFLESIYSKPGLKTCAVYGRRQIGKSTLLREFCKGKRSLLIQSSNLSEYENMVRMRSDITKFLGSEMPPMNSFTEIMTVLANICNEKKTVLVFDEYPYLMSNSPFVPSILQRFIDIDVRDSNSMVIICGSSISMMREETERMDRPLYGRFVNRLMVGPLSFRTCMKFHKNMTDIDALKVYMTVGGIPKYHCIMDSSTYEECIRRCYIERITDLTDEAFSIITNEMNQASIYSGIVACIADGMVKQHEIADKMKIDRAGCKKYLDNLEYIGIVERLHPMLGAPKRPIYRITDNIVAFYYEVIRRHATVLDGSVSASLKYKVMKHDIDTFMGHRFEDVCGQYVDQKYNVKERGRWWGRVNDEDTDIDIVASIYDEDLRVSTLLSECNFRKQPMGFKAFNDLLKRTSVINRLENIRYILFSIGGFDSKLEECAEGREIILVDHIKLFENE